MSTPIAVAPYLIRGQATLIFRKPETGIPKPAFSPVVPESRQRHPGSRHASTTTNASPPPLLAGEGRGGGPGPGSAHATATAPILTFPRKQGKGPTQLRTIVPLDKACAELDLVIRHPTPLIFPNSETRTQASVGGV